MRQTDSTVTYTERDRHIKQTDRDRYTEKKTDRHSDIHKDRQIWKQTDADKSPYIHGSLHVVDSR